MLKIAFSLLGVSICVFAWVMPLLAARIDKAAGLTNAAAWGQVAAVKI